MGRLALPREYVPILALLALAGGFGLLTLAVTFLFGKRRPTAKKAAAYECGIVPQTSARGRFSVKFFLVAILFIVFDVETVFLYPWAVAFRDLGPYGFFVMLPFMGLLAASLVYEWKRGALEWD
ncbi:MAG: NADH-quinone oxidoreductase subunit A [Candidatus Tectomicrobia bacterium]|uniref:NADH-quinone oxidoreductase subunit A n=1 Tax=Tectimicrobiota bacterium TaxID=2528274 RepID=A0A932ZT41_UNCTE|nr:NADH-quinone oxidoreductase subunit A [Candidatus Tectomicrobia bacterium]MBI4250816.1 NADH-quinone oxidoreductase subunit A [Candidatus Tectomicrobia bacterium]